MSTGSRMSREAHGHEASAESAARQRQSAAGGGAALAGERMHSYCWGESKVGPSVGRYPTSHRSWCELGFKRLHYWNGPGLLQRRMDLRVTNARATVAWTLSTGRGGGPVQDEFVAARLSAAASRLPLRWRVGAWRERGKYASESRIPASTLGRGKRYSPETIQPLWTPPFPKTDIPP